MKSSQFVRIMFPLQGKGLRCIIESERTGGGKPHKLNGGMAHMKMYKAIVKDQDGNVKIIESEYRRKTDFIHDLRQNGYKVNPLKVKEATKFDRIMDTTNCYSWDWE